MSDQQFDADVWWREALHPANQMIRDGVLMVPIEETPLQKAAKAMCRADGHDPDALVLRNKVPLHGPFGHVVVSGLENCFAWELYLPLAEAALNAAKASADGVPAA